MSRPQENKNKAIHIWTKEEKEYLKLITLGHHHIEIQELMSNKFDIKFTMNQIKGAIKRYKLNTGFTGKFKKGGIPFNKDKKGMCADGCEKTWFKKGNKPKNYKPIGTERVNGDDYIDIKIADPNKWRGKHSLVWEEHNGPIPEGHAVIFGDGNRRNFDINNLILVSRQQLIILNKNKLIQNDADLTRTGVIIADLYQKISNAKKKL